LLKCCRQTLKERFQWSPYASRKKVISDPSHDGFFSLSMWSRYNTSTYDWVWEYVRASLLLLDKTYRYQGIQLRTAWTLVCVLACTITFICCRQRQKKVLYCNKWCVTFINLFRGSFGQQVVRTSSTKRTKYLLLSRHGPHFPFLRNSVCCLHLWSVMTWIAVSYPPLTNAIVGIWRLAKNVCLYVPNCGFFYACIFLNNEPLTNLGCPLNAVFRVLRGTRASRCGNTFASAKMLTYL
jgi:hypothetical protein